MLIQKEFWWQYGGIFMAIQGILSTTLAGLFTFLGGVLGVMRPPSRRTMAAVLGFAAGVMLTISLADLLPHCTGMYARWMGLPMAAAATASLLLLGMVAAALLEQGVEKPDDPAAISWFLMLAILLHNLPEGVLTLFASVQEPTLGWHTTLAIGMHNIPEGISVAMPLYYATRKRTKALGAALITGLAEPAAALLAYGVLHFWMNPAMVAGLLAWSAGVMCWVSVAELIPAGLALGYPRRVGVGACLGMAAMLLGMGLLS